MGAVSRNIFSWRRAHYVNPVTKEFKRSLEIWSLICTPGI
jgi:hypothetical protein